MIDDITKVVIWYFQKDKKVVSAVTLTTLFL